jgi:hypothetical protein
MERQVKTHFCFKAVFSLVIAVALFVGATTAFAEPWKFGVMSDTQWKANLDGQNPGTVAVGIINQLNAQFISHGVKFVIQVGDLVDKEADSAGRTMPVRAAAAQALYDAGIGFYPLRGNHEGSQAAAIEFQTLYPQGQGIGPYVFGAKNFSRQFAIQQGLSYSFDYENARFMLLDQFTRTDNTNYLNSSNNNIIDQLGWIDMQLSTKPGDSHAFVFSHKGLITENHTDGLFGSDPSSNPDARNAFIGSLQRNGVRYFMGGHDHMHNRAIVASPDGNSMVQNITNASNSYKFYIPVDPSNDEKYSVPAFGGPRETPIVQELFSVGYYIVTVDGPRATVDFYSSPNGCDGDCDLTVTPTLSFTKRETFGYSLNGKEFLVPQGGSYTVVEDRFEGTTAKILAGINSSTATVFDGRPLTKAVDTGWTLDTRCDILAGNILTLWGMEDNLGSDETDVYVLSMSYDHERFQPWNFGKGGVAIATRDAQGNWVNAVDMNFGGTKKFVVGPWHPSYELGSYGVDPRTHTAWAVINYNGDFAIARFGSSDLHGHPGPGR